MKIAMVQEPIKIPIENSDALMLHSQIMVSRSARFEMFENELECAKRKVMEMEYSYKKAKLELEQVQLQSDDLLNIEKTLVNMFFAKIRQNTPLMKSLQERYGDGVRFIFDSDEKNVWLVAIFSSNAPPILHEDADFSGEVFEEQEENDSSDDGPSSSITNG